MLCDRDFLLRFVRAELDTEETTSLLRHLKTCSDCTSFLDLLVRLRANREQLVQDLASATEQTNMPSIRFRSLRIELAWMRPLAGYALAVAVVLLLATAGFLLFRSGPRRVADIALLAGQERYPYRPMVFRSESLSPHELFARAMDCYERNEFEPARQLLEQYVQERSGDADALFYLGVTLYLGGELQQAHQVLEQGLRVLTIQNEEKFHWYLAQVHLKSRNRQAAIKELESVAAMRGEFCEAAQRLLSQLH